MINSKIKYLLCIHKMFQNYLGNIIEIYLLKIMKYNENIDNSQ